MSHAADEWRYSIHTLRHILSCESQRIADTADWLAANGFLERHAALRLTEERLELAATIAEILFAPPAHPVVDVAPPEEAAFEQIPRPRPRPSKILKPAGDDLLGYPASAETAVAR